MDVSVFLHKKRKKANSHEKIKTALTPHREKVIMEGLGQPNRENIMFQTYVVKSCGRADCKLLGEAVGCRLSGVGFRLLVVDCRLVISFLFVGAQLYHRSRRCRNECEG
jgi:hypothetical protein